MVCTAAGTKFSLCFRDGLWRQGYQLSAASFKEAQKKNDARRQTISMAAAKRYLFGHDAAQTLVGSGLVSLQCLRLADYPLEVPDAIKNFKRTMHPQSTDEATAILTNCDLPLLGSLKVIPSFILAVSVVVVTLFVVLRSAAVVHGDVCWLDHSEVATLLLDVRLIGC